MAESDGISTGDRAGEPAPTASPVPAPPRTPEQTELAASIAYWIIAAATGFLAVYAVSALAGRWDGGEWGVVAWIAEKLDGWKVALAAVFSLGSLLMAVFTDLHKGSPRSLRRMAMMLGVSFVLAGALYYLTTRGDAPSIIGERFETPICALSKFDVDDTAARDLQRQCFGNTLESLWTSWLIWLAVTMATILGLRSSLMDALRKLGRKEPAGARP